MTPLKHGFYIHTRPTLLFNGKRGFTLIELLVAMVIAIILAAVAVPSLTSVLNRNAVISQLRNLSNDLAWARSQAVATNTPVTICAKANNANTCVLNGNDGDWDGGWLVFRDDGAGAGAAADGSLSGDEEILRVFSDTSDSFLWSIDTNANFISSVVFNSRGNVFGTVVSGSFDSSSSARFSFILCGQDEDPLNARALIVERTGRALPSRDNDESGVHENANGDDLICT